MSDLVVYLPNHGYSGDDPVFVSWLGGVYYVDDPTENAFKLTDGADGDNIEYSENVTTGYVRQITPGSGTTTIDGLEHLEGQIVYVTAFGAVVGAYTVSGGSITIPSDAYNYQVGLPYSMKIRTMRIEVPQSATLQTRVKSIDETIVRYVKSKNGQAGQEYDNVEYLEDLEAEYLSQSADSQSLTKGGYSKEGYTVIKSAEPYPFTIISTVIYLSVTEK